MFPNLEAEQARKGHSNAYVASLLGVSRQAYEHKKKHGTFKRVEIVRLLSLYDKVFEYLFAGDGSTVENSPKVG